MKTSVIKLKAIRDKLNSLIRSKTKRLILFNFNVAKRNMLIIVILSLSVFVFGQDENLPPFIIENINVTPPEFNGIRNVNSLNSNAGITSIFDYLKKHIHYPEEAIQRSEQGTSVVRFIVTSEGELTNFEVVNSICQSIDHEVISVLKTTNGLWKPGLRNDRPADFSQEISVIFKLDDFFDFVSLAKKHLKKGNELLFLKNRPEKALPYFDEAIKLLPYNKTLREIRGYCNFELGDEEKALSDWGHLETGNKQNMIEHFNHISEEIDISELTVISEEK